MKGKDVSKKIGTEFVGPMLRYVNEDLISKIIVTLVNDPYPPFSFKRCILNIYYVFVSCGLKVYFKVY